MKRTILALIPVPVTGSARSCASRHGYVWLGSDWLGSETIGRFVMRFVDANAARTNTTNANTKPSTRWSRRRPT